MVIKELKKLDVTKVPGPDNINNKILKDPRFELSDIRAHLFNISIQHSFIPEQWKIANVIPIPKVKNPTTPNEYLPIALDAKVFERIIVSEILNHTKQLRKTNKQYGFLPGRNTMDALVQVIEDWEKARDEKKQHTPFFLILQKLSIS
jgi:hypothetical protein